MATSSTVRSCCKASGPACFMAGLSHYASTVPCSHPGSCALSDRRDCRALIAASVMGAVFAMPLIVSTARVAATLRLSTSRVSQRALDKARVIARTRCLGSVPIGPKERSTIASFVHHAKWKQQRMVLLQNRQRILAPNFLSSDSRSEMFKNFSQTWEVWLV
jgi:hypothetical protein